MDRITTKESINVGDIVWSPVYRLSIPNYGLVVGKKLVFDYTKYQYVFEYRIHCLVNPGINGWIVNVRINILEKIC